MSSLNGWGLNLVREIGTHKGCESNQNNVLNNIIGSDSKTCQEWF